jgi:Ca2+-binding RTX toxin-like protein
MKRRKRFAILIGVAAAGVMALGAQTGAQTQAPTPPGQPTPTCNGKPATIVGTDGGDNLGFTRGPDVIVGLGGNDDLDGGRGNDVICGGDGRDSLEGTGGRDTLFGEAGKDTLVGKGKDLCNGGNGYDRAAQVGCEVEKSIEKSIHFPE